jgi:hypothetical protein
MALVDINSKPTPRQRTQYRRDVSQAAQELEAGALTQHAARLGRTKGDLGEIMGVYLRHYRRRVERDLSTPGTPKKLLRHYAGELNLIKTLEADLAKDLGGLGGG